MADLNINVAVATSPVGTKHVCLRVAVPDESFGVMVMLTPAGARDIAHALNTEAHNAERTITLPGEAGGNGSGSQIKQ